MNCPKCQAAMESVRTEGFAVDVDRCTACGGLWFDNLEHIDLKKRGLDSIDTGDAETGRQQNAVTEIDCPRCHQRMVGMVDPAQPHIHFEKCPGCSGVFFDAGEFKDFARETPADFIRDLFGRHGNM